MNSRFALMRYLLDKNVVRYAISGLVYGRQRLLTSLETGALLFWRTVETQEVELFISAASFHVLRQSRQYDEARIFLELVQVLSPTRYHARWTRRIRETTGLSREDASMIALASFGTNPSGAILGTHWLATYDQAMITGYTNHLPVLKRRFEAMTTHLSNPFHQAVLPQLSTPDNIRAIVASGRE